MNALHQAIVNLLPEDKAAEYRAMVQRREDRERDLIAAVTIECTDAISDIASAMRYPRIGIYDIEAAILHLQNALKAAKELDK